MEAQAITVEKPFAAAEEKFSELVARLSAKGVAADDAQRARVAHLR
jgi:hypothetical protein